MAASLLSLGARVPARASQASLSLGSAVTPRSSALAVSRVASNASLASQDSAVSLGGGGRTPRTPKTPKTPTYLPASLAMSPVAASSFSAPSIRLAAQGYEAEMPSAFCLEKAAASPEAPLPVAQKWGQKPEYPVLLGQRAPAETASEEDRRAVRFCDEESLARATRDAVLQRLKAKRERKTWTEKKTLMSL
eukprot:TRINITY_DN3090_c0_g1_i2.p1 TRINITY_DN3090_c0_g1~~TRINITY_DN3090_c0_g1_i2.p1  ORF type:complete len:192 (+),score=22.22 TRINITY_DN3090_c0_g1_i2:82-657(+)